MPDGARVEASRSDDYSVCQPLWRILFRRQHIPVSLLVDFDARAMFVSLNGWVLHVMMTDGYGPFISI